MDKFLYKLRMNVLYMISTISFCYYVYNVYMCNYFFPLQHVVFRNFHQVYGDPLVMLFAFLGKRCIEEVWHETLQEMWRRQSFGNGACWKQNEGRQGNVMFKNRGVNQ